MKNGGDAVHNLGLHRRIAGLDGLRGLAVAMVLGFHLYPRLVPGGWLGVSLFFTLSGFLITTVILRDRDNGTFTFGSFYARRIRRLVPAALLVLTLFSVSWTLLGWFNENHRSDVLFSALQIANWQQIWEGIPYGTALASPVVHYWSLAIEEQAYIVLPLFIITVGKKWLQVVAPLLLIGSIVATLLADGSQSIIYFGTHTRAAEILVGVIVASAYHSWSWRPHRWTSTVISAIGIGYLIAAIFLVHLKDDIVYSGGLIFTGFISGLVIATLPTSRLVAIFHLRPLTWLGTVSYGVYLVHWPVLLTLQRTSLPQWMVSPLTLVLTFVLAQIMHSRFELPMRFSFSPRKILASGVVGALVVVGTFAIATKAPATFEDLQENIDNAQPKEPVTDSIPIFYFGDSKMMAFLSALQNRLQLRRANSQEPEIFSIGGSFARFGCPVGLGGSFRNGDTETRVGEGCDWTRQDTSTDQTPVAVMWSGTWDVAGRRLENLFGSQWLYLDNFAYADWVTSQYQNLFDHLRRQHGVKFIVILNYLGKSLSQYQSDYNNLLTQFESTEVSVLDVESFVQNQDVQKYLPDGTHVSIGEPTEFSPNNDNSGADLYEKWFEPALCNAIQKKMPELLGDVTCPAIDYSPRVPAK